MLAPEKPGEAADRVDIPVPVRHQATGASAGANVHIREVDCRSERYTAKHDRQQARKMLWSHTPSTLGQSHPLASDAAEGSDLPESTAWLTSAGAPAKGRWNK
jgi:hypothetical protein